MKASFSKQFLRLGKIDSSYTYLSFIVLVFILNLFASAAMAQDLDPDLPPGGNFDLTYWKLTRPNQQERGC